MKKLLAVLLLVVGFAQAENSEFGVGVSWNTQNNDWTLYSPSGTVKADKLRFIFEGGIATDYMFVEQELVGPIGFYLGLGFGFPWALNELTLRIPVGLDVNLDFIHSDVYFEIVPQYAIVGNALGYSSYNVGLRYFF
ncbi:MAG: hypothetical protein KU37_02885 [Sulfuricurvum sp. PC08-66]|nr:MAG: hypothetical protein KU37_02885 [Sulfuricurvum sp. PC08-66]